MVEATWVSLRQLFGKCFFISTLTISKLSLFPTGIIQWYLYLWTSFHYSGHKLYWKELNQIQWLDAMLTVWGNFIQFFFILVCIQNCERIKFMNQDTTTFNINVQLWDFGEIFMIDSAHFRQKFWESIFLKLAYILVCMKRQFWIQWLTIGFSW